MTDQNNQDKYYKDLENWHREHLKKTYPKRHELLKIFPEAKEIIKEKIKKYESENEYLEIKIQRLLKKYDGHKDYDMVDHLIKKYLIRNILDNKFQIMRLESYKTKPQRGKHKIDDVEEKKQRAKQYPIWEIARSYIELKKIGNKYIGLCPFHNEKTPSFYLFTDSNQCHCYGCGIHLDNIGLKMKLENIDFMEAVKNLQ